MATNPRGSTRVTQVDPWIAGGEGQLRDLFPLNPAVILAGRAFLFLFRHYQLTIGFILATLLWVKADWSFAAAFILFPILLLLARLTIVLLFLWYRNPAIPLIARKDK